MLIFKFKVQLFDWTFLLSIIFIFNLENLKNFLDKDTNYFDKVDYASGATKSALILYVAGKTGYNVGKGIYKVGHPTEMVMSNVNITSVNNSKLGQVSNYSITKNGLSATVNKAKLTSFVDYMDSIDAVRYNQYWNQVKEGLTAEQRYNLQRYNKTNGYKNVLEDYVYSHKVLKQMSLKDYHSFPREVEAFADNIEPKTIIGGDKVPRKIINIQGNYKGKKGVFEFIIDNNGEIVHRFFNSKK